MKIFFCFIFLFSVCVCEDSHVLQKRGQDPYGVERYDGNYYGENDYKDGDTDGDKSGDKDLIRPCSYNDVNCIRRVFANNAPCEPTHGPAPDPYMQKLLRLYIPQANLTFDLNHVQITGLNEWKIKEFYINKTSDNLVFEVEFTRMVMSTSTGTIRFHRRGKEPISITDYALIELLGVSLTLTIPHVKHGIDLSKGHVYAYVPDATPKYAIGPAFANSTDPVVILAIKALLVNIGLSVREAFVAISPVTFNVFLQTTICNFGHHY